MLLTLLELKCMWHTNANLYFLVCYSTYTKNEGASVTYLHSKQSEKHLVTMIVMFIHLQWIHVHI